MIKIDISLVSKLISEQFHEWKNLNISPVKVSGRDNRTFHLGDEMLVRLPSAKRYSAKVEIEQKWLPLLRPHLSFAIPKPLAMGYPSNDYPWAWSIYKWIEGESANNMFIDDQTLQNIALKLGEFLNELHQSNLENGPAPGKHNFYRGGDLSVYGAETKDAIKKLQGLINNDEVTSVWEKAISSKWEKSPVWLHGDFAAGNILIKDHRLKAIIDFGGMAVGDPACDLVIAWTFLKNKSREIFRSKANLDDDTWARGRGWALWKALITIVKFSDKTCDESQLQLNIINEIISEHKIYNI